MIYCVRHADVVAHLIGLGFRSIGQTAEAEIFALDRDVVVVRLPNVDGHITEVTANDAFHAAGLEPPDWGAFWCD